MRAAEDLLLSAKLYNLKGGYVIHDDGSRCAIGCLVPADNEGGVWSVMKAIRKKYPWMLADRSDLKCPCCGESYSKVMHAVSHIFDSHVYFAHDMTFEQLAGWIDQQDPTPREPVAVDALPASFLPETKCVAMEALSRHFSYRPQQPGASSISAFSAGTL